MSDENSAGLLSRKQRAYLKGDFSPSNEATMRLRIRRRIQHTMRDFRLLYQHHPDEERALTFEKSELEEFRQQLEESRRSRFDPDREPEQTVRDEAIPGMRDAIAYFYLAIHDRGLEDENFAEIVRNAVKQAVEHRGGEDVIADVEISIDRKLRDERLSELRKKYLAEEPMSGDQLQALIDTDPSVVVGGLTEEQDETDDE